MATNIHQTYINEHILFLELDNPPANTLSKSMKEQFLEVLADVEQNKMLRALVITGSGQKFCTGDDLKEAVQNAKKQGSIIDNLRHFSSVIDRFEALTIPTIAAINGWCIGGGLELALCCDIRVAVPDAKFISAGVNVGLTASAYRLPRLIGVGRAKRMLLTGATIDAPTALDYGLITDIFEPENLFAETIRLAHSIASKAPLAIKATKAIANAAFDISQKEGYILQQKELETLARSEDHQEALRAFATKRKPNFEGR
ncbi:MAG: enoyl-CoA hydratase/isomerase family protein [Chitinophagales bacterium]